MTDIFKKFLLDDVRRLSPSGRFVGLAAFGKHPGWDDHVEDLGLETDSLNHAKITFYVNGIGGQIDSGAWEKLEPAQQLPAFKHLFLWQRSGQILLGRLWSSSDGKGRKRYPMVLCLHFAGVTLRWALAQGLPALAELEQEIQKTNSAEDVRSLLNRKRAALREALASGESGGEYAPVSPEALNKILHPAGDPNSQGFLRVLYQLQSQFRTFAPGNRSRAGTARAQQIRVPSAAEGPERILLFWSRFFLTQVDASVPLLLCLPLDEHWVDVTVGDPESHEFFALRASPKAVPLVSEVPFTLDEDFLAKARGFLEAFERGQTSGLSPATEFIPAEKSAAPAKGGLLKWLGVGCVLVLAVAAAMTFLGKRPKAPDAQATAKEDDATNVPASAAQPSLSSPAQPEQVAALKKSETNPPPSVPAQAPKDSQLTKPVEPVPVVASTQTPAHSVPVSGSSSQPVSAPPAADAAAPNAHPESPPVSTTPASPPPANPAPSAQTVAALTPAPQPATTAASAAVSSSPASPPSTSGASMTNSIGMVLVRMPSGFWVGKYEITWAEYAKIMDTGGNNDPRMPVNQVSWNDAAEFCRRLTQKEADNLRGKIYSLPTQKQWEEFRAGQKLEDLPPGSLKSSFQTSAYVTDTTTNKLGLYGVLGNVWEWCLDGETATGKLQAGGEVNNTSYNRLVTAGKARPNSGFRCVLIPK